MTNQFVLIVIRRPNAGVAGFFSDDYIFWISIFLLLIIQKEKGIAA